MAQTKDIINIKNAYDDPRFNCEIDQKTGYKTNAMLSMPIANYEGDVIGVAQIINKTNGECSTCVDGRRGTRIELVNGVFVRVKPEIIFKLIELLSMRAYVQCTSNEEKVDDCY